jgi:flavin reductase (DIM6/NTAB) family NADH-FMN oxidoreductase RutF
MLFHSKDLQNLEDRYRRNLINSLHSAKSVCLVGTANRQGHSNLAIFSQMFHIGANPPLIGLLVRPDSVDRHTLKNIRETERYSIQHIKESYFREAHQTSARYPENVSEFEAVGLNEIYLSDFPAPFVEKADLKIGLKLNSTQKLEVNGTVLVIGEIVMIEVDSRAVSMDGYIDPEIIGSVAGGGLDGYYSLTKLARLSYAKPNEPLKEILE